MTHDFTTLTSVLSRCSAKVADQVIAEISTAISAAKQDDNHADEAVAEMAATVHKINAEKAAARREKAAARRAAKKADKAAAKEAEAAARCESCGEAEAELPSTSSSSGTAPCTAFTDKMVKYLRQCPAQQMLAVLNSYVHLLFTGNLIHTDADHRFLENFIYLARLERIIQNDQQPTMEQAAAFLFDNPALPLPRAERRRLQRLARKHRRTLKS